MELGGTWSLEGRGQSEQDVLTEPKHRQTWDAPFTEGERERPQTP